METNYYYSKLDPTLFFAVSLFFDCTLVYSFVLKTDGFRWWTSSTGTFITGALLLSFCLFITFRIYKNWLLPAIGNIPAFTISEHGIDFRNSYLLIPWNAISDIRKRRARSGNIIAIKLKDIDRFIAGQAPSQRFLLRLQTLINAHFSIYTAHIAGDAAMIYDSIVDSWDHQSGKRSHL